MATHDQAGKGGLSTSTFGACYAYNLKLSRNLNFRPALGANYGIRSVDLSKLTFGDQLLTGNSTSVQSTMVNQRVGYVDVNAGAVLYGKEFWVGYSVYHLNKPNNSLTGSDEFIDARHSLHAGYRFPMKKTVKGDVVRSLTFAANYKSQGKWDQFDIGAYYLFDPIIVGFWYRGIPGLKSYAPGYQNHDAATLLVGTHLNKLKVAYSYDITISKLYAKTGGSHEISLIYEYANAKRSRRKFRHLACPQF